jgi:hypothetical protein
MNYYVSMRRIGPAGDYDDGWFVEKKWPTGKCVQMNVWIKKGRVVKLEILDRRGATILTDREARRKLKRMLPTVYKKMNTAY